MKNDIVTALIREVELRKDAQHELRAVKRQLGGAQHTNTMVNNYVAQLEAKCSCLEGELEHCSDEQQTLRARLRNEVEPCPEDTTIETTPEKAAPIQTAAQRQAETVEAYNQDVAANKAKRDGRND